MSAVITLEPRVDLQAAVALKADISSMKAPLSLKADKVKMLGTPGLQVLLAARRHFSDVRVEDPSPDFLDCLKDFGVAWDDIAANEAPE